MAGDEGVVTQSGKETYGLDRFFSSLYGKTVPSVCFLSLALISMRRGTSYPIKMEQVVRERVPDSPKAVNKSAQGKPGRPKGSGQRNRREVALSSYLRFVQGMIRAVLTLIGGELAVRYFLYDGAFGHNDALQMLRQTGLHRISKLRHDAALYFLYDSPYAGRGRRKQYGSKLDDRQLPDRYLKSSSVDKGIRTTVYPMRMGHKCFPREVLKWLPKMPEPIVIDQAIAQVTQLDRINYATSTP